MPHTKPFNFYTERRLVSLTGRKAKNLPELLQHLREVSEDKHGDHFEGL